MYHILIQTSRGYRYLGNSIDVYNCIDYSKQMKEEGHPVRVIDNKVLKDWLKTELISDIPYQIRIKFN